MRFLPWPEKGTKQGPGVVGFFPKFAYLSAL